MYYTSVSYVFVFWFGYFIFITIIYAFVAVYFLVPFLPLFGKLYWHLKINYYLCHLLWRWGRQFPLKLRSRSQNPKQGFLPSSNIFPFTRLHLFCFYFRQFLRGTRWRSWLRHYATSRKVAGSIPDGVTGIFLWLYSSGRFVALGSTQPLTEMSPRNPSWG
jgi:hypothetical protein